MVKNLEITDVALIICNVANSDYQQNSRVCIYLVPINLWSIFRYFA